MKTSCGRSHLFAKFSDHGKTLSSFCQFAPLMMDEATDVAVRRGIEDFVVERQAESIAKVRTKPKEAVTKIRVKDQNFQTIKVQLRALGLIAKSQRPA